MTNAGMPLTYVWESQTFVGIDEDAWEGARVVHDKERRHLVRAHAGCQGDDEAGSQHPRPQQACQLWGPLRIGNGRTHQGGGHRLGHSCG